MDLQPWVRFAHILGAFTFVLAHGVSVFTTLKIRRERDPARIAAMLDLSRSSFIIAASAVAFLLLSGIAAGFVGNYWGHLWIWASIAILVLLFLYMGFRGTRYHDAVRHAVGSIGIYDHGAAEAPTPDPTAMRELLDSPRALELAAVGGIGLLVILWLMVLKPF
jgi:hypothetical protein